MSAKAAEGRRFASRLSILFGVPLWSNYFGTGGYAGDAFMGIRHQYGGPLKLG
jgi:hypothetical protein